MATSTPPKGNAGNKDRSPKRPTPQQSHARAAKARLEQERKKRQRIVAAGIAGAVVLAIVVVLIAVKLTSSSSKGTVSAGGTYNPEPAPGEVVTTLNGIPAASLASSLAAYGKSLEGAPHAINGVAPPAPPGQGPGGPPEFFYMGANYCPYCAAERWAMVTALSKFGTFSNLGQTTSSATDVDPNTPTFTFYQSSYSSPYISFVPVETTTNQPSGNGYVALQVPTAAQQQLAAENDPNGSIPFIYIAGKFLQDGAPFDPGAFAGKSMIQVAQAAADPTTKIGQDVQAAAGSLVQDICAVTKNQPANVCSAFGGSASGG